MSESIFVNPPVADRAGATAFQERIGACKDDTFRDGTTARVVLSETISAMLLIWESMCMDAEARKCLS